MTLRSFLTSARLLLGQTKSVFPIVQGTASSSVLPRLRAEARAGHARIPLQWTRTFHDNGHAKGAFRGLALSLELAHQELWRVSSSQRIASYSSRMMVLKAKDHACSSATDAKRDQLFSRDSPALPYSGMRTRAFSTSGTGPSGMDKDKEGTDPPEALPQKSEFLRQLIWDLRIVPPVPLALGLAGAIPFVGLTPPVAALLPLPALLANNVLEAQAAYGACILTFLGGPHWGLAMANYGASTDRRVASFTANTVRYLWSVLPSLIAWPALLLDPATKLIVLSSALALAFAVDVSFSWSGLVPSWYFALRIMLTLIATSSLLVSLPFAMAKEAMHHHSHAKNEDAHEIAASK